MRLLHGVMQGQPPLELCDWLVAWRKYAIIAVAAQQLTFAQAVAHEAVISEVVSLGKAQGYGTLIGPLYDECERLHLRLSPACLVAALSLPSFSLSHARFRCSPSSPFYFVP